MGLLAPQPFYHANGESFTIHWAGKGKILIPAPATSANPPPSFGQNITGAEWQDIIRQIDSTFEEPKSGCCSWTAPNEQIGTAMRDSLNTQFNPKGVAFSMEHFWSPSSWKFHTVILFRKIPLPAALPVHPGMQLNAPYVPEASLVKN